MTDKTPTLREKVKMYEDFLHKINMMMIAGDSGGISELLDNADNWSYMHRCSESDISDTNRQKSINHAFWNLCITPKTDKLVEERQSKYLKFNS